MPEINTFYKGDLDSGIYSHLLYEGDCKDTGALPVRVAVCFRNMYRNEVAVTAQGHVFVLSDGWYYPLPKEDQMLGAMLSVACMQEHLFHYADPNVDDKKLGQMSHPQVLGYFRRESEVVIGANIVFPDTVLNALSNPLLNGIYPSVKRFVKCHRTGSVVDDILIPHLVTVKKRRV
jgi:hypothetical protein